MKIHIHRSGESYGPYSVERVRALLKEGRLAPDDLAWHDGASAWLPLISIPEITAEPPPAALEPVEERPAPARPAARPPKPPLRSGYLASVCILLYYLWGWVPQRFERHFPDWWPLLTAALLVAAMACAVVCLAAGLSRARFARAPRRP